MIKNTIKITLFYLLFATLFASCSDNSDERLFDKSASERAKENLNTVKSELISASNGWVFDYYPDINQPLGGFSYVVKFNEDNVDVYSAELQDDYSKPESSSYDVISRGGSILTFNGYNSLMHEFAEPDINNYQGKRGDYEFLMSIIDKNTLKAKGTFTGNNLFLRRNEVTPQEYLVKVSEISTLISSNSMYLELLDGGFDFLKVNQKNIVFPAQTINNADVLSKPYTYTSKGIRFYSPITLNDVEIFELILDDTKTKLTSINGEISIKLIPSPIDFSLVWRSAANSGFYTQEFLAAYNKAKVIQDGQFGGSFPLGELIRFGKRDSNTDITFSIAGPIAAYNLDFIGLPDQPKLLVIKKNSPGLNWRFVPWFDPMVNLLVDKSPYITQELSTTSYRLQSKDDPNFWFIINK